MCVYIYLIKFQKFLEIFLEYFRIGNSKILKIEKQFQFLSKLFRNFKIQNLILSSKIQNFRIGIGWNRNFDSKWHALFQILYFESKI